MLDPSLKAPPGFIKVWIVKNDKHLNSAFNLNPCLLVSEVAPATHYEMVGRRDDLRRRLVAFPHEQRAEAPRGAQGARRCICDISQVEG